MQVRLLSPPLWLRSLTGDEKAEDVRMIFLSKNNRSDTDMIPESCRYEDRKMEVRFFQRPWG